MYLFDDRPELAFPDPVIVGGIALAVCALAFGFVSRHRLRRRPPRGPAYQVFRYDAASALIAWGSAQLAFGAGWALRVEGLRMPLWSYLGLLVGVALAVMLWRRERASWPSLAKSDGAEQLPDGSVQLGVSQTWEMGFLAAGGAGLLMYLSTAGHAYGHPIHWLLAGLSLLPAYAAGMAIWSPRFKLTVVRARRQNATMANQRRSDKARRADRKHGRSEKGNTR